jgi:hypothetical protein
VVNPELPMPETAVTVTVDQDNFVVQSPLAPVDARSRGGGVATQDAMVRVGQTIGAIDCLHWVIRV